MAPGAMVTYTCERCGRHTSFDRGGVVPDELQWWLAGSHPSGEQVTMCPQHISVWALRRSGYGRGKAVMAWAEEAKSRDPSPDIVPFAQPYPIQKATYSTTSVITFT